MTLLQRSPSMILRLSLCAATLLAVGACDGDGSDVAAADAPTSAAAPASSSPSESPSVGASASASASASESPSESPSPTSTPTEPAASPSASDSPKPRLIGYAGGESAGVTVHKPADARRLDGAPAAFKDFIARTAQELVRDTTCSDSRRSV